MIGYIEFEDIENGDKVIGKSFEKFCNFIKEDRFEVADFIFKNNYEWIPLETKIEIKENSITGDITMESIFHYKSPKSISCLSLKFIGNLKKESKLELELERKNKSQFKYKKHIFDYPRLDKSSDLRLVSIDTLLEVGIYDYRNYDKFPRIKSMIEQSKKIIDYDMRSAGMYHIDIENSSIPVSGSFDFGYKTGAQLVARRASVLQCIPPLDKFIFNACKNENRNDVHGEYGQVDNNANFFYQKDYEVWFDKMQTYDLFNFLKTNNDELGVDISNIINWLFF